jgi:hypothetical protein
MPTTVTSTIGTTGRTYSTLQAWEDACPANLITDDKIWKGEAYNDSEFTGQLTFSGTSTDATHYIVLTAAAGQSFQDHGSVRSNALMYDQTKGVGMAVNANYSDVINVGVPGTIISRFQVKNTAGNGKSMLDTVGFNQFIDSIFEATRPTSHFLTGGFCTVVNCVLIQKGSGNGCDLAPSDAYYGCTVVKPSDVGASGTAFVIAAYGANRIMQNCAVFGFSVVTGDSSGTRWDTTESKNNATDLSSGLPGSSNQHSVSYSQFTPFTDADKDSQDWRAIDATSLDNNGFYNSVYPTDISGTARDVSTPTIGAWELSAAAPPASTPARIIIQHA